jgi:hypothetical protein
LNLRLKTDRALAPSAAHPRHRGGHALTDSASRLEHEIRERPDGVTRHLMAITIEVMLAQRKMSVTELAEKVGVTIANISVLKKQQ